MYACETGVRVWALASVASTGVISASEFVIDCNPL